MTRHHRLTVAVDDYGERLDVIIARHLDDISRTLAAELIRAGRVRVGDRLVQKPSSRVHDATTLMVEVPPLPPSALQPEDIELTILAEDDDWIIVDKAAGMVVHPAHGHPGGTLVNALLGRAAGARVEMLAPAPTDEPFRPGIVHRLDKDTSGCLVVARTPFARAALEAQFKEREVGKRYLAVVHGRPPEVGEIDAAVGRDPRNRKRMSVRTSRGRSAQSRYRVLEQFATAALVEVTIATGRTHQIRVHMRSIGHPVVGDVLYGGRRGAPPLSDFPRQALHAAELHLTHPRTGARAVFRAPLPSDMVRLLAELRSAGEPASAADKIGAGRGLDAAATPEGRER